MSTFQALVMMEFILTMSTGFFMWKYIRLKACVLGVVDAVDESYENLTDEENRRFYARIQAQLNIMVKYAKLR